MRFVRCLLALMVFITVGAATSTVTVPIPPAPTLWATDTAGFLKPQTVDALNTRLSAYQDATGHQILVYVAPTTGTAPTEDWTVRAFAHWKVGRKGIDDGLVLFVFSQDHKVRIEVGYGLESVMTDARSADIIRDAITPKLQAGQPDAAVTAGVDQILATVGGEPRSTNATSAPAPRPYVSPPAYNPDDEGTDMVAVWMGVGIAILIVLLVMWGLSKLPKGHYVATGGYGDGGWWGLAGMGLGMIGGGLGGGFSGGGGMSGGGGATGSW